MARMIREELVEKLAMLGIRMPVYQRPEGYPIEVLEIQQVGVLVQYYETMLRRAVETRPIRIELKPTEAQSILMEAATQPYRDVLAVVRGIYERLTNDPTFDGYTLPFDLASELGEALNPMTGPDGDPL